MSLVGLLVGFLVDVNWRPDSLVDDDGRLVVLAGGGDVDGVRAGGGRSLVRLNSAEWSERPFIRHKDTAGGALGALSCVFMA